MELDVTHGRRLTDLWIQFSSFSEEDHGGTKRECALPRISWRLGGEPDQSSPPLSWAQGYIFILLCRGYGQPDFMEDQPAPTTPRKGEFKCHVLLVRSKSEDAVGYHTEKTKSFGVKEIKARE